MFWEDGKLFDITTNMVSCMIVKLCVFGVLLLISRDTEGYMASFLVDKFPSLHIAFPSITVWA